jgi:hypothetical protein
MSIFFTSTKPRSRRCAETNLEHAQHLCACECVWRFCQHYWNWFGYPTVWECITIMGVYTHIGVWSHNGGTPPYWWYSSCGADTPQENRYESWTQLELLRGTTTRNHITMRLVVVVKLVPGAGVPANMNTGVPQYVHGIATYTGVCASIWECIPIYWAPISTINIYIYIYIYIYIFIYL